MRRVSHTKFGKPSTAQPVDDSEVNFSSSSSEEEISYNEQFKSKKGRNRTGRRKKEFVSCPLVTYIREEFKSGNKSGPQEARETDASAVEIEEKSALECVESYLKSLTCPECRERMVPGDAFLKQIRRDKRLRGFEDYGKGVGRRVRVEPNGRTNGVHQYKIRERCIDCSRKARGESPVHSGIYQLPESWVYRAAVSVHMETDVPQCSICNKYHADLCASRKLSMGRCKTPSPVEIACGIPTIAKPYEVPGDFALITEGILLAYVRVRDEEYGFKPWAEVTNELNFGVLGEAWSTRNEDYVKWLVTQITADGWVQEQKGSINGNGKGHGKGRLPQPHVVLNRERQQKLTILRISVIGDPDDVLERMRQSNGPVSQMFASMIQSTPSGYCHSLKHPQRAQFHNWSSRFMD